MLAFTYYAIVLYAPILLILFMNCNVFCNMCASLDKARGLTFRLGSGDVGTLGLKPLCLKSVD